MSDHQKIEQEAAEWLAREDRGLAPQEQAAFDQWLNQSTAHRVSYLRLKAAWTSAGGPIKDDASSPEPWPGQQRAVASGRDDPFR